MVANQLGRDNTKDFVTCHKLPNSSLSTAVLFSCVLVHQAFNHHSGTDHLDRIQLKSSLDTPPTGYLLGPRSLSRYGLHVAELHRASLL